MLVHVEALSRGESEVAQARLSAALAAMRVGTAESRILADMLEGTMPATPETLRALTHDVTPKSIACVALGLARPREQSSWFALARELNYGLMYPSSLLERAMGSGAT